MKKKNFNFKCLYKLVRRCKLLDSFYIRFECSHHFNSDYYSKQFLNECISFLLRIKFDFLSKTFTLILLTFVAWQVFILDPVTKSTTSINKCIL